MTKQDVINGYMINEKHVIAEMLYDTITRYEATIEAQNVIIRDKTAIMEAMVDPKSCSNCKHSKNVRVHTDFTEWFCDMTPFNHIDLAGEYDEVFKTFNCSLWVNVFEKAQQ